MFSPTSRSRLFVEIQGWVRRLRIPRAEDANPRTERRLQTPAVRQKMARKLLRRREATSASPLCRKAARNIELLNEYNGVLGRDNKQSSSHLTISMPGASEHALESLHVVGKCLKHVYIDHVHSFARHAKLGAENDWICEESARK